MSESECENPADGLVRLAIICSGGRTGSNLLVNMLNRHHPQPILCHGEVFHQTMIATNGGVELGVSVDDRDSGPIKFLEHLEAETVRTRKGLHAYGFKVFSYHNRRALEHIIQSGVYRVIYLHRPNLLAQFSSLVIAEQTGEWMQWRSGQGQDGAKTIQFDENRFRNFVRFIKKHDARVRSLIEDAGVPWACVTYKGIMDGDAWDEIGTLAGVGRLNPVRVDLLKQNTSTILDRFEDPRAVQAHLDQIGKGEWAVE